VGTRDETSFTSWLPANTFPRPAKQAKNSTPKGHRGAKSSQANASSLVKKKKKKKKKKKTFPFFHCGSIRRRSGIINPTGVECFCVYFSGVSV
jgi:hypothetical protein